MKYKALYPYSAYGYYESPEIIEGDIVTIQSAYSRSNTYYSEACFMLERVHTTRTEEAVLNRNIFWVSFDLFFKIFEEVSDV